MTLPLSLRAFIVRFDSVLAVGTALSLAACESESSGTDPGGAGTGSPIGGASGTGASSGAGGASSGASAGGTGGALGGGGGMGAAAGSGGIPTGGAAGVAGAGMAGSANGGAGGQVIVGGISDLRVEQNPRSVLSVYVRWTTAEAASSIVQFGEGALTWEIEGPSGVTEHEVLVIGMHAETAYQIRAASTGASGTMEGTTMFTTGALPAQIPVATISVHDPARAQPGFTLMNVQKGDGTNRALSGAPPAAVIYDAEGQPVWYFIHGTGNERGGAISVDQTDRGVLIGPSLTPGGGQPAVPPIEVDWAGNTVWTCSNPLCGVPDQLSHHAGKLSNGNYIVMRDASSGGRIDQVFIEFSPEGQMVHTIGVTDAMAPPGGAGGDWAHGNAISVDLTNDVAYLSFRWLGLVKMTYSTKTPIWHIPASYGQDSLNSNFGNVAFMPSSSQFTDIHNPHVNADGTILFFDNGGFSGVVEDGNPGNRQTRAVEYRIDETARTATLTWEWPGNFTTDPWYKDQLYVPFWGDADRLANGNVLITAGRRGTSANTPESRIIEVTRETGEVVWELRFPKDHGVYRSERLESLPTLRRIAQ